MKRFSIRAKRVKVVKKMATSSLTKTMNRRSKIAVCLLLYKEDKSGFFPDILIILQFFSSSNYRSMIRKVALLYIKIRSCQREHLGSFSFSNPNNLQARWRKERLVRKKIPLNLHELLIGRCSLA